MRNTSLILLLSALLFSCRQVEQTNQKSKRDYSAINDTLTKKRQLAYQEDAVVGFSVAIVGEMGEIYENGFGFTDIFV